MDILNNNLYSLALQLSNKETTELSILDSLKLKSKNSITEIEINLYQQSNQKHKNHIYIYDGIYNRTFPNCEITNPEIIFNTETYLKIKLYEFVGEVNFSYTYFKNYYLQVERVNSLPIYSLIADFCWDNGRGKKGYLPSNKIYLEKRLV